MRVEKETHAPEYKKIDYERQVESAYDWYGVGAVGAYLLSEKEARRGEYEH